MVGKVGKVGNVGKVGKVGIVVFFKPNKVLTRQKILPGDSKNSTVDGQS